MLRSLAIVVFAVVIILFPSASIPAAEFGTADEAKAMLDWAVAAVKEDETKALDMFNKGQGGFKDRDLYVFCANASDGIVTAHPYGNKGKQLREIFGKKGYPLGQEIMEKATEGGIKEVRTGGRDPAQTSRLRRPPFTRRSAIRFVASATTSATTRNNLPRTYVRLWHIPDMRAALENVRFGAQSRHS